MPFGPRRAEPAASGPDAGSTAGGHSVSTGPTRAPRRLRDGASHGLPRKSSARGGWSRGGGTRLLRPCGATRRAGAPLGKVASAPAYAWALMRACPASCEILISRPDLEGGGLFGGDFLCAFFV